MLMAEREAYRRFQAPPEDGQTLVEPPRGALGDTVAKNRSRLASLEYDVQGRSLAELSAAGRIALADAAWDYTRQYRDVSDRHRNAPRHGGPMILSGHQPQLFHAGVWYKNFILGDVANEVDGGAIHLLVDSDLCRTASIRVPAGTIADPRLTTVLFDAPAADLPFEERAVLDEATFTCFADVVRSSLGSLVRAPLVASLWPLMPPAAVVDDNLGRRIAQGRHRLEATMGNDTLELPQSHVCKLAEFHWFVAHLLAHLPRFWTAHNESLAAYRRAHKLRNRAHPVPDLVQSEGWLEAPFWMWSTDAPQRQPVFARQSDEELVLTNRHGLTISLALAADRDATIAVEQLVDASRRGIKLRTRALATTLFARLVLSDLFLHGIGGAKYDQVTDDIARRFFGFDLPTYATASATLRLPICRPAVDNDAIQALRQELRELTFHPERFIDRADQTVPAVSDALRTKARWISEPKTVDNARVRHAAIAAANEALMPWVAARRAVLEHRQSEIARSAAVDSVLNSREYSFCLFPREHFERLLAR